MNQRHEGSSQIRQTYGLLNPDEIFVINSLDQAIEYIKEINPSKSTDPSTVVEKYQKMLTNLDRYLKSDLSKLDQPHTKVLLDKILIPMIFQIHIHINHINDHLEYYQENNQAYLPE